MSNEMKRRMESLESAVGGLRGEVGELRGEVGELRGEVGELRSNMDSRFKRVDERLHSLTVEQARARGDIEWLKENTVTRAEYRQDRDLILSRIDGVMGFLRDFRFDMAKQNDRLDQHDRRISRLENGRA